MPEDEQIMRANIYENDCTTKPVRSQKEAAYPYRADSIYQTTRQAIVLL